MNRRIYRQKSMWKPYSIQKAERIIQKLKPQIEAVARKYDMPPAAICAVLRKEMPEIDLMDFAADLAVALGGIAKKDSSIGYMQIFGWVGLNAVNFAVDRGLATYDSLGIQADHRLDPHNTADVRMIWKKMQKDRSSNLEIAALNLISCAEEQTGRIDFAHYTEEEWKLLFTRYNQNTRKVTPYGEKTYEYYQAYLRRDSHE